MKVLIIFLSLVFMGCVTANTRDLSAINPKTEPAESSPVSATPRKLANFSYHICIDVCERDCVPPGKGDHIKPGTKKTYSDICEDECHAACQ